VGNLADLVEGLRDLCLPQARARAASRGQAAPADDRVFDLDWL